MVRRFGSLLSTLALLTGFVAAPHAHLHLSGRDAASDSHHAQALLHSHVASHDSGHDHGAPADPHDGDTLSVDRFVFQVVKNPALEDAAALLPQAVTPPALVSSWTSVNRQEPAVYGSPPILPSASRGPPILLPTAV